MKRLGLRAWRNRFGNIFPIEGYVYEDKEGGRHRVLEVTSQYVIID